MGCIFLFAGELVILGLVVALLSLRGCWVGQGAQRVWDEP